MPVLFPKLYISTDLGSDPMVLDNVTKWARGVRIVRSSTYRDTGWQAGKTNPVASTGTLLSTASDVPIVGLDGSQVPDKGFTNVVHATPDEMAHVPPRYKKSRESGYLFGFTDAALEQSLPDDEPRSATAFITIDTATDICTAGPSPFVTGDLVTIYGTVMPSVGGIALTTATSLFTVVKIDANLFFLRTLAGALANFTAAGTNVVATLVSNSPQWTPPIPTNEAGVVFVPDAWNPRISTTDPRK